MQEIKEESETEENSKNKTQLRPSKIKTSTQKERQVHSLYPPCFEKGNQEGHEDYSNSCQLSLSIKKNRIKKCPCKRKT